METYKKRNRSDSGINPKKKKSVKQETELVLKLEKSDLFDQYAILPHAELNSIVYKSVDNFVVKYLGDTLSLSICTPPLSSVIQDLFREVYRAHYEDELQKIRRYLRRHYWRVAILLIISIFTFLMCSKMLKLIPDDTIFSYLAGNISVFCLWEVGYTQFATRDIIIEKKRVTRALNAEIDFQ